MAELSNFNSVVDSLLNGMDGFLSSKTVVGEATHIGDTIIVPLVDNRLSAVPLPRWGRTWFDRSLGFSE